MRSIRQFCTKKSIAQRKNDILQASLPYVDQSGWTTETLASGSRSLGLSGMAHGIFTDGGIELVHHVMRTGNNSLASEMAQYSTQHPGMVDTTELLGHGIKTRLMHITPYIRRWHEAMILGATPSNASGTFDLMSDMADELWFRAGDESMDLDWYQKRVGLVTIYVAAEARMLVDKSEEFQDTKVFVDQRLEEARTFRENGVAAWGTMTAQRTAMSVQTAGSMAGQMASVAAASLSTVAASLLGPQAPGMPHVHAPMGAYATANSSGNTAGEDETSGLGASYGVADDAGVKTGHSSDDAKRL